MINDQMLKIYLKIFGISPHPSPLRNGEREGRVSCFMELEKNLKFNVLKSN